MGRKGNIYFLKAQEVGKEIRVNARNFVIFEKK
jgi:hypothetical protein